MKDIAHIVIYPGGGAGNFVRRILVGLLENYHDDVLLSKSGHTHFVPLSPTVQIGLTLDTNDLGNFTDSKEEMDAVTDRIETLLIPNMNEPIVAVSHDMRRIHLYRELFPKANILVITANTIREVLGMSISHHLKITLGETFRQVQQLDEESTKYLEFIRWKQAVFVMMRSYLGDLTAAKIIENMYDEGNRNLFLYITMLIETGRHNDRLKKEYTADTLAKCIEMPFSVIMDNNISAFLAVIEKMHGTLTNDQTNYISKNFAKYHAAQNQELMADPATFIYDLREDVLTKFPDLSSFRCGWYCYDGPAFQQW